MEFPPNLRPADTCGGCKHFVEEDGLCDLFQIEVVHTEVCDSFEASEDE